MINPAKIEICSPGYNQQKDLAILRTVIKSTVKTSNKYLGITIDQHEHLTWTDHINEICNK